MVADVGASVAPRGPKGLSAAFRHRHWNWRPHWAWLVLRHSGGRCTSRCANVRDSSTVDSGFTVVESVVALFVAAIVLLSLAVLLISTARAGVLARQTQQAGDLLNERIEYLRSQPYAAMTMSTTDPQLDQTSDSLLASSAAGGLMFSPNTTAEALVTASVGAVNPHITTPSPIRNKTSYLLKAYITCPAGTYDCGGGAGSVKERRATVVASWLSGGRAHTRRVSTMLTAVRRGLALPYFRFGRATTVTANVNGSIALPAYVTNLGARDAWNLTLSTGTWTWWQDTNKDGLVTAGTDVQMTGPTYDADGNGVVDTGRLETGTTMNLLAVRTATSADVGTSTVNLTATSASQPTVSTASQTFIDTITTSSAGCTGCTISQLYVQSPSTTGSTVMLMSTSVPTAVTTASYDVSPGGSGPGESDTTKVAVWQRQASSACSLAGGGTATITLYGMPVTGTAGSLTVYVGVRGHAQSRGFTPGGSATVTPTWTAGAFTRIDVSIAFPSAGLTFANNDYVEVRLQVPATSPAMRLAFGTTTYPAVAKIPITATGSTCL